MEQERSVISEANLPGLIVFAGIVGFILVLISVGAILDWWGFRGSMYYRVFGDFIYLIFYGLGLYAIYEVFKVIKNRKSYIVLDGEFIQILAQGRIRLSSVKDVYIENRFLWKNLVICQKSGTRVRVRSYLLAADLSSVRLRLIGLVRSQ